MRAKDIIRFNVSMNNSSRVQIGDSVGDFIKNFSDFVDFRNMCGDCFIDFGFESTLFRHILDNFLPELMT